MVIYRLHIRSLGAQHPDLIASKTPGLTGDGPQVQNTGSPLPPLPWGYP